ncbi:MAG: hypothetical protein K8R02_07475 [Anaerohalosphaeraceae bacterium]|nr:hypothetical protein [Anaerohalosphaeraceae bacterium]
MSEKQHSSYQQNVIKNYYQNLDTITLTKLQELVTELYLADSAQKQKKLWANVEKAMIKLKIKPAVMENILKKRNVVILAKNLNDWL